MGVDDLIGPANESRAPFSTDLLFPIYIYQFSGWQFILLATCLLAGIISLTLKMEAICSSETSVATQQTTRRHTPEDDTLLHTSTEKHV
jgi:hypothetical protein